MKKFSAYLISIGSAIFLFAQQVMAAATDPGQMQDLYGVPNMQLAYGVGPNFGGLTLYEKVIFLLRTPLVWIILVPTIFIIGLVIFLVKRRKNKNKSDVQKNIQNRRT